MIICNNNINYNDDDNNNNNNNNGSINCKNNTLYILYKQE